MNMMPMRQSEARQQNITLLVSWHGPQQQCEAWGPTGGYYILQSRVHTQYGALTV